jgi:hypothetical protein
LRSRTAAEIAEEFNKGREKAAVLYEQVTEAARRAYEDARNAAQKEYKVIRSGVESRVSRATAAAKSERQQASWETLTVFDALKGRPRERFQETVKQLERIHQELAVLEHDAIEIMKMRRQWREFPPVEASVMPGEPAEAASMPDGDAVDKAIERTVGLSQDVRAAAVKLHRQTATKVFEGGWPFGVVALVWLVVAVPCGILFDWRIVPWLAASCGIAAIASAGVFAWLWPLARRHSGEQFQAIQRLLAEGRLALRTPRSPGSC